MSRVIPSFLTSIQKDGKAKRKWVLINWCERGVVDRGSIRDDGERRILADTTDPALKTAKSQARTGMKTDRRN